MATSSKKDVDLLVRIGVLEKLVDKLQDRVLTVESVIRGHEGDMREMLSLIAKTQEQGDPWEGTETVPVPTGGDPDEVTRIMES